MSQIALPTLVQRIVADTSPFAAGMNAAQSQSVRFGQSMAKVGAAMSKYVTAPLVGIAALSVKAFAEAEKQALITEQLIKTTGASAGVTAGHVADLTKDLQKLTGVSDETAAAAANIILTFKSVRNVGAGADAIFDRTLRAARDVSIVMGTDMASAATQLAKAVEDPVRGMTALRRAGVTFTKDQEGVIKSMVETGNLLGAQRYLLDAVEGQLGGVGQAYGRSLAGQIERAKNVLDDFMERIGQALAPMLRVVVGGFAQFFNIMGALPGPVIAAGVAIGALVAAAGPLMWITGKLVTSYQLFTTQTLPALSAGFIRLSGGHSIAAVAARAHTASQTGLIASLRATALAARMAGTAIVTQIRAVFSAHPVMLAITAVFVALTAAIAIVVAAFRWAAANVKPFQDQLARLREIWNTHVLPVFRMIVKVISTAVVPIFRRLGDWVTRIFTRIADWLERNQEKIKLWATNAVTALLLTVKFFKDVFGPVIAAAVVNVITVFVDLIQIMWNTMAVLKNIGEAIGKLLTGDFEGAADAAGRVVDNLGEIASAAKSATVDTLRRSMEASAQSAEALAGFLNGDEVEATQKEVAMEIDRAIKEAKDKTGQAEAPSPEEAESDEPKIDESSLAAIEAPMAAGVETGISAGASTLAEAIADAQAGQPITVDVAPDSVLGRGTFGPDTSLSQAADKLDSAATKLEAVAKAQGGRSVVMNGVVFREPPEAVLEWFHEVENAATRVA